MTQTARYGKTKFVGGLTWVPLSRPRDMQREAVEQVKRYEGDCYVVRSSLGAGQVGVGRTADGAEIKAVAFAAYVANAVALRDDLIPGKRQRINDWLGVFEVENGKYGFVAVREGAILAQGDYFGSYEDAIEHLEHGYGVGGWAAVFGPEQAEEHGYHNFVRCSLSDIVTTRNGQLHKTEQFALKSIHSKIRPKGVIAALVVGGLVAGGYFGYQTYTVGLPNMSPFQPAPPPPPKTIVHYERKWAKLPTARAYAEACERAFAEIAPGGWRLAKFECTTNQAAADYERGGARLRHLVEYLPAAQVDQVGNKAQHRTPLDLPAPVEDDLFEWSAIDHRLRDLLQAMQVTHKLGPGRAPEPPYVPPEQMDKTEIVPPFWREYPFAIGPTPFSPERFMDSLEYPGVRLSKIVYQKGNWGYEGIIYAK